jgi:hypothetical protein
MVRRILIEQIGYEKICYELNAINLDKISLLELYSWFNNFSLKIVSHKDILTKTRFILRC